MTTSPDTPKDTHYAKLRRAYRDEKAARRSAGSSGARQPVAARATAAAADGLVRLYGLHTVRAALDNPARKISRMLVTRNAAERLGDRRPLRPALHGRDWSSRRTSTRSPAATPCTRAS